MPFESEREFEQHIRQIIDDEIIPFDNELILLKNKKAVDMLLCLNGRKPALYFVEIKYHKDYRLGTGHGNGGGFQPEIIKREVSYFEKNMRWILGDMTHDGDYWLVDNATIRRYLSGDGIEDKYNNIQNRLFREVTPLKYTELVLALAAWLKVYIN